jgi:hypothetical protein
VAAAGDGGAPERTRPRVQQREAFATSREIPETTVRSAVAAAGDGGAPHVVAREVPVVAVASAGGKEVGRVAGPANSELQLNAAADSLGLLV